MSQGIYRVHKSKKHYPMSKTSWIFIKETKEYLENLVEFRLEYQSKPGRRFITQESFTGIQFKKAQETYEKLCSIAPNKSIRLVRLEYEYNRTNTQLSIDHIVLAFTLVKVTTLAYKARGEITAQIPLLHMPPH